MSGVRMIKRFAKNVLSMVGQMRTDRRGKSALTS